MLKTAVNLRFTAFLVIIFGNSGYKVHQVAIDKAIHRVLDSGWYIMDQEVEAFEAEFATYIGVQHAIGVGNGTDALSFALQACDVGIGDLVFTVSLTAVATVAAIELTGARTILVDIDPTTYTITDSAHDVCCYRV